MTGKRGFLVSFGSLIRFRVLNVVFSLSSTSADIQLESDLFLRDMRKILSVLVTGMPLFSD